MKIQLEVIAIMEKSMMDQMVMPVVGKAIVARSLFYMALRYNDLSLVEGNPDNTTVGSLGDLSYLLTWNKDDVPDDYEMHRNNVIYTWQHNRNPFIDLPNLADYVYGAKQDQVFDLSTDIDSNILSEKQAFVYFGSEHAGISSGTCRSRLHIETV